MGSTPHIENRINSLEQRLAINVYLDSDWRDACRRVVEAVFDYDAMTAMLYRADNLEHRPLPVSAADRDEFESIVKGLIERLQPLLGALPPQVALEAVVRSLCHERMATKH